MKLSSKLALCRVREFEVEFATGKPVTFAAIRNTNKSPNFGPIYGQDIEPAGQYVLHDPKLGKLPSNWKKRKVTFKAPLVLKLSTDNETYGPNGWKARLAREFRAKRKTLSCKLRKAGFDGIITCDDGVTNEIVDLRTITCKR